jgi:protein-tyrosine phosphatase
LPEKISSAGVGALVDNPADPSAIQIAEKHGVSLEGHKGVQFTSELGRKYDLILVMEKNILKNHSYGSRSQRKTMLFGHWLGQKKFLIL